MYKIIGANQSEYGPVSAEQIRQWIGENRVNAETMAQALGETSWRPISTFTEFASSFPAAPTPPPFPPHLSSQTPPPPMPPAPPSFGAGPGGYFGRDYAVNEMSAPAIGLMIVGILGIVYAIYALLAHIIGSSDVTYSMFEQFQGNGLRGQNPELLRLMQNTNGFLGALFALLHGGMGAFALYGALQMKKLENHSLCVAAAIVGAIPWCCPCCFLNLAIGIWALIVLNRPEIRQHFNG